MGDTSRLSDNAMSQPTGWGREARLDDVTGYRIVTMMLAGWPTRVRRDFGGER